jgi:sulfur relay (sulfurtransferase) DsrF/TusC family protein
MENRNITIKKDRARWLRISSEDKATGSISNSQFTVNLPPTGGTIDTITGFMLKYAAVPNIFPNVPAYANTLQITKQTGAVVFNVTVPVGQYSSGAFITALQAAINTAINPDTVAITLSSQQVLNFTFTGDNYSFNFANSTIANIIGLTANIAFAAVSPMQSIVNLQGETEVWIHSKSLNQSGLTETDGNFSVVDVIPLNVAFGVTAYINYPSDDMQEISFIPFGTKRSFRQVDIVLRNRNGDVLTLPPNFFFTMMMKIYHN